VRRLVVSTAPIEGLTGAIQWLERWVIDGRLWIIAETQDRGGRYAVVYDPYRDELVVVEPIAGDWTCRLVHATGSMGRFELVPSGPAQETRTVWRREAWSWHS